jgi:hypothetical protein
MCVRVLSVQRRPPEGTKDTRLIPNRNFDIRIDPGDRFIERVNVNSGTNKRTRGARGNARYFNTGN